LRPARRDEEKSRVKECIFSHRSANHAWDPRNQHPEPWRLFNTRIKPGESMRVFPSSNWTELDVWEYIRAENVPVVPLYFAKKRPIRRRGGTLILVDDERLPLLPGEAPRMMQIPLPHAGCYPLTGAIHSDADTLDTIIAEMRASNRSERQSRVIDHGASVLRSHRSRCGAWIEAASRSWLQLTCPAISKTKSNAWESKHRPPSCASPRATASQSDSSEP
jgi:sulfate adenylyltransferase subunit 2